MLSCAELQASYMLILVFFSGLHMFLIMRQDISLKLVPYHKFFTEMEVILNLSVCLHSDQYRNSKQKNAYFKIPGHPPGSLPPNFYSFT